MKTLFAAILLCSTVGALAEPTEALYQKSCFACHSTGAAGAPKYRKIDGLGKVDDIRDRAFAALK